jgi:hypothetical protein
VCGVAATGGGMIRIERIKWHMKAFKQLRQSNEVIADLHERAGRIAAGCGPGYATHSGVGKTRGRATVITATHEARKDNAASNTILRNIDRGR